MQNSLKLIDSTESLSTLRSLEIIDFSYHQNIPIHIIGLGAIGSKVFEQLYCLGARNLVLHDFDEVEHHNLHNQLYLSSHIGLKKIEAAIDWAYLKYGEAVPKTIQLSEERITEDSELDGVVLCCVDSFDSREAALKACVKSEKVAIFIEGRCAPKYNEVRCINPFNEEEVEKFVSSLGDDDAPNLHAGLCGMPISFCTTMSSCAITMVAQTVNFLEYKSIPDKQKRINSILNPMIAFGVQKL